MVTCPVCGASEMHPTEPKLLIRAYKVQDKQGCDWSQCLVCAGHYNPTTLADTPNNYNPKRGWFAEAA